MGPGRPVCRCTHKLERKEMPTAHLDLRLPRPDGRPALHPANQSRKDTRTFSSAGWAAIRSKDQPALHNSCDKRRSHNQPSAADKASATLAAKAQQLHPG